MPKQLAKFSLGRAVRAMGAAALAIAFLLPAALPAAADSRLRGCG